MIQNNQQVQGTAQPGATEQSKQNNGAQRQQQGHEEDEFEDFDDHGKQLVKAFYASPELRNILLLSVAYVCPNMAVGKRYNKRDSSTAVICVCEWMKSKTSD